MFSVMKKILLGILVSFLVVTIVFLGFKITYRPSHLRRDEVVEYKEIDLDEILKEEEKVKVVIPPTEEEIYQQMIDTSDVVNVLVFGTDGARADTLMVFSYSKKNENISIISVPRDTKNVVEGRDGLGQDKINAVYGFGDGDGGSDNQRKAVAKLLDIPIHYYIKINYNGIKAIVNTIGGIQIYVPFDMDYDDEWAKPPLHIHLNKGSQLLNGDQAMQYLRWRKNSSGNIKQGDINRIGRQQKFVIKVIKKSIKVNLIDVINLCYKYVKTDMELQDLIYYGTDVISFDFDSMNLYTLPGEIGNYVIQDVDATKELIEKIYMNEE